MDDRSAGELRRCSQCGVDKPPSEFYCKANQPGVLRSACKACHRDSGKASTERYRASAKGIATIRRYTRGAHRREYSRAYHARPEVKVQERERDRSRDRSESNRAYRQRPEVKESLRQLAAAERVKNPARGRAHAAVSRALKSGRLQRPAVCPKCGSSKWRIEAHHHRGYDREFWLDVEWMCQRCHLHAHKFLGDGGVGAAHQ